MLMIILHQKTLNRSTNKLNIKDIDKVFTLFQYFQDVEDASFPI